MDGSFCRIFEMRTPPEKNNQLQTNFELLLLIFSSIVVIFSVNLFTFLLLQQTKNKKQQQQVATDNSRDQIIMRVQFRDQHPHTTILSKRNDRGDGSAFLAQKFLRFCSPLPRVLLLIVPTKTMYKKLKNNHAILPLCGAVGSALPCRTVCRLVRHERQENKRSTRRLGGFRWGPTVSHCSGEIDWFDIVGFDWEECKADGVVFEDIV